MALLSGCEPAARASRSSPLGGSGGWVEGPAASHEWLEGGQFFQDMRARGLGYPILVASDGAPGIIRALRNA